MRCWLKLCGCVLCNFGYGNDLDASDQEDEGFVSGAGDECSEGCGVDASHGSVNIVAQDESKIAQVLNQKKQEGEETTIKTLNNSDVSI